jgi:hypothetical protein
MLKMCEQLPQVRQMVPSITTGKVAVLSNVFTSMKKFTMLIWMHL